MNAKEQAVVLFVGALVVGLIAPNVVRMEAAVLGLTSLEVAMAGLAAAAVVRRVA